MTSTVAEDAVLSGAFGPFVITAADRREVLAYRLSLLTLALAQLLLLIQWHLVGSAWLGPWLVLMVIALGLALQWVHIYLRPLHRALQLLWLLGACGGVFLACQVGPDRMAAALLHNRLWILAIGPFFAALAGLGFKEYFCFGRLEAIGLTLLLPFLLLGALLNLLPLENQGWLWFVESLTLLVLALRKFQLDPAADIGDKSVFAELERRRQGRQPLVEEGTGGAL